MFVNLVWWDVFMVLANYIPESGFKFASFATDHAHVFDFIQDNVKL